VAVFDDGSRYEGGFAEDLRAGQGRMILPDGHELEGTWEAGLLNGPGIARYPNGDVYEGNFVDGQREGSGRMIFAESGEFEGLWRDGQPVPESAPAPEGTEPGADAAD
jgi:hypothetical protein